MQATTIVYDGDDEDEDDGDDDGDGDGDDPFHPSMVREKSICTKPQFYMNSF